MAENEKEEDPFFDWLCTKRIKELSEFLVAISALLQPKSGENWRKRYLLSVEEYFIRKQMRKEDFKSTKEYLFKCFDFFNKKEYFADEADANRNWAIFVIGWIASNVRAAIEQARGAPDNSMQPMHG